MKHTQKFMEGLIDIASLALYLEISRPQFLQRLAELYDESLSKDKPDDESIFQDEAYWAIQDGISRDQFIQLAAKVYDRKP